MPPISRTASCPHANLPPHVARQCALAAARLEAWDAAAAGLPGRSLVSMGLPDAADRRALAAQLLAEDIAETDQAVTVTLRPTAAGDAAAASLLRNTEVLLFRRLLLDEYAALLRQGKAAARWQAEAKGLSGGRGGAWLLAEAKPARPPAPPQAGSDPVALFLARLESAAAAQKALRPSAEGWLVDADALAVLERAVAAIPESAALRLLLAEAQLRKDMPQRSIDACTEALRLAPWLGRARYVRALAHWRLQQMSLAEDDLTAALGGGAPMEDAVRIRRLRARGAVRQIRHDEAGMCADFSAACALGDCEGLAAARNRRQCLEPRRGNGTPQGGRP